MKEKTRAFRLNPEDDKLVEHFLKENPVFDFSTLVRTALFAFMKDPKLKIHRLSIDETLEKSFVEDREELDNLAGHAPIKRSRVAGSKG